MSVFRKDMSVCVCIYIHTYIYIYIHLYMCVSVYVLSQLCPTLWNPVDCSLLGFLVHGDSPGNILEWVAIPFSRGSSQPRDRTQVFCIAGGFFSFWFTREILIFMCLCVCVHTHICTLYYSVSLRAWFQHCVDIIKWVVMYGNNNTIL